MTDYQPIACDIHSQLELSIMHGQTLQIQYQQGNEILTMNIKPKDIVARTNQGEFLLAINDSGELLEIRLDKLLKFKSL